MSDKKKLDKNIRRGIKLFNEQEPRWFDRVTEHQLANLDIANADVCMTAIFDPTEDYEERLEGLGLTADTTREYGFDFDEELDMDLDDQYDFLSKRWIRYIKLFQEVAP